MKRFNNILVAYDGSENSVRALEAAERLATDQQSMLTVVYVHDHTDDSKVFVDGELAKPTMQPQPIYGTTGFLPNKEYESHAREQMIIKNEYPDRIISDAKSRLSNSPQAHFEVVNGKASTEIIHYAKESDSDLIVIGNRGLSGIKKLFMGSVSQKVANEAACAVFIVK